MHGKEEASACHVYKELGGVPALAQILECTVYAFVLKPLPQPSHTTLCIGAASVSPSRVSLLGIATGDPVAGSALWRWTDGAREAAKQDVSHQPLVTFCFGET